MFVRFPHTELYAISKALSTVLSNSSKNPITNYLVFTINADTGKASVRCTNLDVIMSKSLSGVEVSGKGSLDFVPVEGKRFLGLLKHSDEAPVRLKLDTKKRVAEFSCGMLKSNIRMGYQDASLFPGFNDTARIGVVGSAPLQQALEFCQKLVGSDSYQIMENTAHGMCAGSQSRFGVFTHEELAGMPLSVPVVVLKPLMAFLSLLEDDLLRVEAKEGFVVLRHDEDPDEYLAFRRSLENLPDLTETVTHPLELFNDVIRIEKMQLERVVKRVAIALEPSETRMHFSVNGGNQAGMMVEAHGSNDRNATEIIEVSRRAGNDQAFTLNYSNLLTAISLSQQESVVLRVSDNFVKLFECGDDYELQVILAQYSSAVKEEPTPPGPPENDFEEDDDEGGDDFENDLDEEEDSDEYDDLEEDIEQE